MIDRTTRFNRHMQMMDIDFSHVSKRYVVRSDDSDVRPPHGFVARQLKRLRSRSEAFWALRDVSFQVQRGEALGIIGQNGAGKSTILKLLSGITTPTEGRITINGRLSALIEVGSGFHPELSGRENIYLSGSILGMRRRDIDAKLERIVEFAGVRRFIDAPVKRYSSGMYVRLGFAIAAHLEPDVLLLDEVLAVGDAAFQAKCIQRIKELEAGGTTIVFISHDLTAVERICDRAILMRRGTIEAEGTPRDVIKAYHDSDATSMAHVGAGSLGAAQREWPESDAAPGDEVVRLRSARIRTLDGATLGTHDVRRPIGIELTHDVLAEGHLLIPNFHLIREDGSYLFGVQDTATEWRRRPRPIGRYTSTAWLPGNFLAPGTLSVDVAVSTHVPLARVHALVQGALSFKIDDHFGGDSARGDYMGDYPGVIRPVVDWTTEVLSHPAAPSLDDSFARSS